MTVKWMANFGQPMSALLLILGSQWAGMPASAQTPNTSPAAQSICPAQLPDAIDAIANRPQFSRARWGILVEPLSPADGQTLYNRQGEGYFIPASNEKLLTTAAALAKLGTQFRIRTSVYGTPVSAGEVSLRVVGRGDPSLTDAHLASLAQQLKSRGIRQVGQMVVEDSYFQGQPVNPNWEWEDVQAGYGAPVNSLIVNENAINLTLSPQAAGQPLRVTWDDPKEARGWRVENDSVTVGPNEPEFLDIGRDFSRPVLRIKGQLRAGAEPEEVGVAIVNPAENFLQRFQQALAAEGIAVGRAQVAAGSPIAGEVELAVVESPPLSELVMKTNQESNNLYAEVLLRSLGTVAKADAAMAGKDTADAGLDVLKAALTQLGVNAESYIPEDGSGLSRHNLVSPEALVQTLRAMASSPAAEIYQTSLPVAGVSGTLSSRFRDTTAQGIVQAKTGTVTGVSALSGYARPLNYPPLVFSIIVNQSHQSAGLQRQAIDEIVLLLTRLRSC
ncbi:D-alanyl-D-alanine carboxypeptidase/D-alanyl-D-alanine-endopeptidase [Microcoleus sp. FACHB-672]|uniref:D-alanyl-D-alanine carboxypeptidase/D-alanyl-D-alanine endopeptidase n=1 Tax=Microcoleus sp. FACHB-672 TaxID=2692825 RepID=UPI001F54FC19|nr:D-alanyl-D-alanine carboxypeptidase/D-alanyl-D-alanine-endopeptidase [Microcoleus sp. FACHB-672]